MIRAQWIKARDEWRVNRRLRLAVLVALIVLSVHALVTLNEQKNALVDRYTADLELQARMQGINQQSEWTARAEEAQARLEKLREQMPAVTGSGLAQAELQSWLSRFATDTAVMEPMIRVEDTLEVPNYPGMWQVLARLEGKVPEFGQAAFVRALSEGLPWIQVERLEIDEGTPARINVVVRGYYRHAPAMAAESATEPMTDSAGDSEAESVPEPEAATDSSGDGAAADTGETRRGAAP